jgi:hypothetical protein
MACALLSCDALYALRIESEAGWKGRVPYYRIPARC